MPMAPVKAHTEYIDAGPICFAVEYRVLNDDNLKYYLDALKQTGEGRGGKDAPGQMPLPPRPKVEGATDCGVSIHVCEKQGEELVEHVRFDCFEEDPHYHYITWGDKINEIWDMDVAAIGEARPWAIETIRTRLPQMLTKAGAKDLAKKIDMAKIAAVLPTVTQVAEEFSKKGLPAAT